MKRITLIFITALASVVLFGQTATTPANYKEGDFSTKAVKVKTAIVDGSWTIGKNKTSKAFELRYGTTVMGTLTTAGAFSPVSFSTTGNATITGTISSSSLTRGHAAFVTTGTRVAVYVPGATANDYFFIQPDAVDGATRPVAGDFCNAFAKTDSVVVMRQAGTTSALGFDWFRIK